MPILTGSRPSPGGRLAFRSRPPGAFRFFHYDLSPNAPRTRKNSCGSYGGKTIASRSSTLTVSLHGCPDLFGRPNRKAGVISSARANVTPALLPVKNVKPAILPATFGGVLSVLNVLLGGPVLKVLSPPPLPPNGQPVPPAAEDDEDAAPEPKNRGR